MSTQTKTHVELTHAGTGTALALVQLSAIIPGLLPALALAGILAAAIALPVLALGLLASALATPPYVLWRMARLAARRRRTARAGRYSRHQTAGDGIDEFWAARGSM